MPSRLTPRLGALLLPLLLLGSSLAQDIPSKDKDKEKPKAETKPDTKADTKPDTAKESLAVTQHSLTLGGTRLDYQATAGTLALKDDEGKPTANVFFVAYTKKGAEAARRPLTFTFNGGPGSSSVWLHMGAFGPKRVLMKEDGSPLPPPTRIVDNEQTLLDLTDLVFIDPVTTGFSRPAPGQSGKQFHGVEEDIQSVGEFIRLYTTKYDRWASPKFLAGESYGTTRAAGLANYLQDRHGMNLNGILLISTILNFQTARFDEGNDLPYALFLPTYTATAWFHKKLASDLQADLRKTLDEVEPFALGEYSAALAKGSKLSKDEAESVRRKLARYTGLSEDYVERSNLRIEISRFTKELLRKERRTVGRFDSRFEGVDADAAGERAEYDPSYATVQGAYTAALQLHLRDDLKVENDQPYEILTGRVQPWDFGDAKNRYLNVAPRLRRAMTKNRDLRVFVANGYYDLATPYFATEYTFNHLELEPALASHVTMTYYEAGHMMYVNSASHQKLKRDVARFLQGVVQP
jgi:carboxypeptidase C (cathepsin A)